MVKVGVVGCRLMGAGIAEVSARSDLDVVVIESDRAAADAGRARLEHSLARAEAKGKITCAAEVMAHVRVVVDLNELADRDVVVEAIAENEQAKTELLIAVDKIVESPDAIIASNTPSIPIMKLGSSPLVRQCDRHPLLQPGTGPAVGGTSPETMARARAFVEGALGKKAIDCQDRAGFVVNALLIPFVLSAIRMLESGFATAEDIDRGLVLGAAHPQGPRALVDLIGLDTTKAVAESLYEEFKEPLYASPPLLNRMVDAGLFGRGFHTYQWTPR
ncbi:3-hydroxybutyryl-CoA dehydrogenase [Nocardioides endophyticus]|uniref:3-hydroxybutyryl-CoA dehydrogenase n=1 Tax=Nocardioides endophyticus TaxID=1353775 RepID=A0ABP8YEJ6_9ACTN